MKILIPFALAILLAACASPYRQVYTSPDGDYYLEESSSAGAYYATGSVLYADIGFHPWWVNPYNPLQFVYYSAYSYPYYFSVWYPPVYSPFYRYYGYYSGYYPGWCPPYRVRRTRDHSPVEPPVVDGRALVSQGDIWRTQDNQSLNRMTRSGKGTAYKPLLSSPSMMGVRNAPAKPSARYSTMGASRPSGLSSGSARATSSRRSAITSGVAPRRSKD